MAGWLAGQLLTWETCPTSPGWQGLSTLAGTPAPPTAIGKLPSTTALCARLGWVSAPFLVWGQHSPRSQGVSLSLGQALAGRLTAHNWPPAHSHHGFLDHCFWLYYPFLPGPTSLQGPDPCKSPISYAVGLGGGRVLPQFPSSLMTAFSSLQESLRTSLVWFSGLFC